MLLGSEVVFVPIAQRSKSPPKGHTWKGLSLQETTNSRYIAQLQKAPSVAALLGPCSADLVAIDFDLEGTAEVFLALNPSFNETLQTRGKRGRVLWVRMEEPYPAWVCDLRDSANNHLGEWRGGECYSIIAGAHKDGGQYQVLVEAPPVLCRFGEIKWPRDWQNVPSLSKNSNEIDEISGASAMQKGIQNGTQKNVGGSALSSAYPSTWQGGTPASQLTENWPKRSPLESLHHRFIAERWQPAPNQRNHFIKIAIPFLFNAMCESAAFALAMRYHADNVPLFRASAQEHEHSVRAHLKAVHERYRGNLNPSEQAKYASLRDERERAAFRICRHLSKHESIKDDCKDETFFLSYEDLATRLLTNPKTVYRLMKRFVRWGIVEKVRNGQRRMLDVRPQATVWRYLF